MPDKPAIPAAPIRNGHMPAVGVALIVCLPLGLIALGHSGLVARCWQAGNREGNEE